MPQVSVCQTESYDPARMQAAVRAHFEALDLSRQIRPDLKIVIKPNLVMKRAPEDAATTHPALVEAVIRQLQQLGAQDITIAESSGGPYAEPLLKSLYETCGMAEAARRTGAKLNLGTGSREIGGNGQVTRRFTVIDPIADADLILNLCKLKTHCMTVLSGAVKNLFGCIPGLMKPELHMRYPEKEDFCRMLLDLSAALPPVISFVDAVEAMEGDGPTGGRKSMWGLPSALLTAMRWIWSTPPCWASTRPAFPPSASPSRAAFAPPPLPRLQPDGRPGRPDPGGTVFAAPLQTDGFFFSISGAAAPGRQKGHPMAAAAAVHSPEGLYRLRQMRRKLPCPHHPDTGTQSSNRLSKLYSLLLLP